MLHHQLLLFFALLNFYNWPFSRIAERNSFTGPIVMIKRKVFEAHRFFRLCHTIGGGIFCHLAEFFGNILKNPPTKTGNLIRTIA